MAVADIGTILGQPLANRLFPRELELIPQINELYELELAAYESKLLSEDEILANAGYFARVGGTLTRHFLICSGEPVRLPDHSSSRLRSFFKTNQFRTGYATHGLFPYRGKFHPQMVKGLLNAMGLKRGETVLDPMMGSGTVLIEASLMGIRSIGVDTSPFCQFMSEAKVDALTLPLTPVRQAFERRSDLYDFFRRTTGQPEGGSKIRARPYTGDLFRLKEEMREYAGAAEALDMTLPDMVDDRRTFKFLLLAYLDSAGYSERSQRVPPYEQFCSILERYLFVAEKIQAVLAGDEESLAEARALQGDARQLPLDSDSIDGVIFSPPYSFAIDYLANDSFHLDFLGVNQVDLRERMVGLRGRNQGEQFALYQDDMKCILSECARVLKPGRICTIVVGTNNNQLAKILRVPPEEVRGIHELVTELAAGQGLDLVRKLTRQINGMANTMRTEYILLFERV